MSDAAQKAVEKAIHDRLVEMHAADPNAEGKTPYWWPELAGQLATAVLAVLSETHAVVELPEPQSTFEGNDDENGWQLWASPLGEGPLLFEDGELHYLGVTTYDMKKPETLAASLLACARAARSAEATR